MKQNKQEKLTFSWVDKADATKDLSDLISDSRKDLDPMKTRRIKTGATIAAVTAAYSTFLFAITDTNFLFVNVLTFLAGVYCVNRTDTSLMREIKHKERSIRILSGLKTYFRNSAEQKVSMPDDLDLFIQKIIGGTFPDYQPKKEKSKKRLKVMLGASALAAIGLTTLETISSDKSRDFIRFTEMFLPSRNDGRIIPAH